MNSFTVSAEVKIDIYHAWEYYFNQISSWWPKDYYTSSNTKRFIIDTFIGGKAYEDYGEGGGLVWGEVIGVDYPNSLQLKGNLIREFGGPASTYEKFAFQETDGVTKLTYTADFIGITTERSIKSLREGWSDLLKNRFKKFCDTKRQE